MQVSEMFRKWKGRNELPTTAEVRIVDARKDLEKAGQLQSEARIGSHRAAWTAADLRKVRERNNIAPAIKFSMTGEA